MAMEKKKKLRLYLDFMSQPSRAVLIFCRMNNIDVEIHLIKIAKAQQRSPEFKAINPMAQVPAIDDHGFKLFESHAILRYLATTAPGVPDHWYPADPTRRAKIDSVLDWHHGNLRRGAAGLVLALVLAPVFGLPVNQNAAAEAEKVLQDALSKLEEVWLRGNSKFLAGFLRPTIADLSLSCELTQLQLLDPAKRSTLFGPRDKIRKWLLDVEQANEPHFTEVHKLLRKAAARYDAQRAPNSKL